MSDRIVTLARYDRVNDAEVAQNTLSAAGIDCVFAGENIVRLEWLRANTARGIKLQVREEDADEAEAILAQAGLGNFALPNEDNDAEPMAEPPDHCAACGSSDFRRVPKMLIFVGLLAAVAGIGAAIGDILSPAVFLLLISAVMIVLLDDNWRCRECSNGWR
jgi:hypothetical protein